MKTNRLCVVLCPALLSAGPATASEPMEWMMRADAAVRDLNFDATMVRHHGNHMHVARIQQRRDHTGLRQQIYTEHAQRCLHVPASDDALAAHAPRPGLFRLLPRRPPPGAAAAADGAAMMQTLAAHYDSEMGEQTRIGGRICQRVSFHARDEYRYGCDLCLDIDSGLPLRVRMHKGPEEPAEQYVLAALEVYASAEDSPADTQNICAKPPRTRTAAVTHRASPWAVADLPPGFEVRQSMVRTSRKSGRTAHHLVIADPMSRVSVFVVPKKDGSAGSEQRWIRHAYVTERDAHRIMVLGVVPAPTKQRIGESIRLK